MSARITATIIASGEPITVKLDTAARGPAGADGTDGPAGPNAVTSATTSDGTANLSVATISSQGAVLVNPEFDNGIIAEESSGYSRLRVGNVIIRSAEGSVDCGVVDTTTVNTTTLRATSTEYGNNATFTYGNATAVANHLTALGGGATGVDVFQAATQGDARDAMGLGEGDDPVFKTITTNLTTGGGSAIFLQSNTSIRWDGGAQQWIRGLSGRIAFGSGPSGFGTEWGRFSNGNFRVLNNIWMGAGGDVGLVAITSDDNNILAQRDGANAQTFRLYNTWTSTTNFERLNFRWDSNVAKIGTEKGSAGGTARALEIETDGTSRAKFSESENSMEMLGASGSVILASPNGTRYRITVENDGTLTTTAI